MKVKTKEQSRTVVTIKLAVDEAYLLSALADFPYWNDQNDTVSEFCESLHNALGEAGYTSSATAEDFVNSTSVVDEDDD